MGTYAMTGGATGIGAAIKRSLRDDGHRVVVVDIKDADIVADLSSPEGREAAIRGIRDAAADGLDGFVPCAGVGANVPDPVLIANVNYYGTTELVEGVKDLVAGERGAMVLISSNSAPHPTNDEFVELLLAGKRAEALAVAETMETQPVYSGTKLAMARWMRRVAADYAASGVRINAVAPGYTETPMTAAVANDPTYGTAIKEFVASIPVGRPGMPEDIANAVCYLLAPEAGFICGSVLFVDGGHDAMTRPDQF
jgi:NAD(P)-dependent dehydrogenase (short-subunit alcohol dehydrogenase family)